MIYVHSISNIQLHSDIIRLFDMTYKSVNAL